MALWKRKYLPPVNPVYVGDRPASEMDLSILSYDATSAEFKQVSSIDEIMRHKTEEKISWINISGLKDTDSIKRLGEFFDIHTLSIEDILHTEQQPKVEIFEEYKFLSMKTIQREKNFHHYREEKRNSFFFKKKKTQNDEMDEFLIDQVSMIIMKNVLLTFQEIPGDPFDRIRKAILENIGDIRKAGIDYLAYSIIDAGVDEYFLTLNHLEEDIENFEDRATKTSDSTFIEELQDTKRYLLQIKRAISPLKDNMLTISRRGTFFQTEELKPFLQDLYENLNHAIAIVDNNHEWLSNIMDVNLSVLSHQMNKVMKVLAMISTIFIPLTFVAGIYGMNFRVMPEIEYRFGYPIILCCMGIIAIIMIIYFKVRRWF